MPDRWTRVCRRLVPEARQATVFDPALADLHCDWAATGRPPGWRRAILVARLALQCRRLRDPRIVSDERRAGPGARALTAVHDVRLALRRLVRQPLFTVAAVLTLALGIGANLAISSLVYTHLLAPIPVDEPGRLVRVMTRTSDGRLERLVSYPDFSDARSQASALDLAAHAQSIAQIGVGDAVESRSVELVSGNYFRVMRLVPLAGRLIDDRDDEVALASPVVVLSEPYWRARFGGRADAVGQTLHINGQPFEIVGVAPAGYRGTFSARVVDLWTPIAMQQQVRPRGLARDRRGWGWLMLIGRLADGVTLTLAQADLDLAAADHDRRFPSGDGSAPAYVAAPASAIGSADGAFLRPVFLATLAFTGLLFLVTCANLAGMMQARMTSRRRELAIRQSLGASRARLLRGWLTECAVLAALGGAVGLVAARAAVGLLATVRPPEQIAGDLMFQAAVDWRIAAYAVGLSALAALLFGLAPAWRATRRASAGGLGDHAATATPGRLAMRVRRTAVVVQLAVSGVLLLATSLLVTSVMRQQAFDVGFETQRLGLLGLNLTRQGVPPPLQPQLALQAFELVGRDPDVRTAAVAASVPLGGGVDTTRLDVPGHEPPAGEPGWQVFFNTVTAAYFDTLGLSFTDGGAWSDRPALAGPVPAVINATMAQRFWPDRSPVGQTISLRGGGPIAITGVVEDSTYFSPGEEPRPFIYFSFERQPQSAFVVHVRTTGDPAPVVGRLRRELAALDARLAPDPATTFEALRRVPLFPARVLVVAAAIFGGLALVLAGIGLYGVVAMSVSQRTREIGVRMALGAHPGTVLRAVLREAFALVALGLAVVSIAGVLVARGLERFLFDVGTFDPIAVGVVVALLVGLALAAAWVPARRAAAVDPVEALRQT